MHWISEKYEGLISRHYDEIGKRASMENIESELRNKREELLDNLHYLRLSYSTSNIVNLLDIKLETKQLFIQMIQKIGVYRIRSLKIFVIKYNYDQWEYRFSVNQKYEIKIEKDKKILFTYDLIREFRPLNFNNITGTFAVENYVNLFIKNDNIKLGMLLMGYFYLLEYYQYTSKELDKKSVIEREEMRKLNIIFNNNTVDNFSTIVV